MKREHLQNIEFFLTFYLLGVLPNRLLFPKAANLNHFVLVLTAILGHFPGTARCFSRTGPFFHYDLVQNNSFQYSYLIKSRSYQSEQVIKQT